MHSVGLWWPRHAAARGQKVLSTMTMRMMKLDRSGIRSIGIRRGTRLLNAGLLRYTTRMERALVKFTHAGRRDPPTQKKVMSLLVDSARLSHRAFAMHVSQLRDTLGAAGERFVLGM
jgi:hypothetical protein